MLKLPFIPTKGKMITDTLSSMPASWNISNKVANQIELQLHMMF